MEIKIVRYQDTKNEDIHLLDKEKDIRKQILSRIAATDKITFDEVLNVTGYLKEFDCKFLTESKNALKICDNIFIADWSIIQ